ncbi:MAG: hypothetical protein KA712_03945 [Myxococcales bacterium]|nr:hypothetical protein [Myxococcales bacterium]
MKRAPGFVWPLCLVLLVPVACDDDDSSDAPSVDAGGGSGGVGGTGTGGLGGIDTRLDKNKRVDQLSPDELAQACKDFQNWGADFEAALTPKLCRVAGVLAAVGSPGSPAANPGQSCQAAVAACEASATPDAGAPTETDCTAPENCTATVGELETCLNDSLARADTFLSAFPSCAMLAAGTGSLPLGLPQNPASCAPVEQKCPDLPMIGDLVEGGLSGGGLPLP